MSPQRRHVLRLGGVTLAMFGFGFALVPVYGFVCDITGFNGTTSAMKLASNVTEQVDTSRTVTVEFLTTVNGGRPWEFSAETQRLRVHPGKLYTVNFTARNTQDLPVVAQAVPSVAPWNAARHLKKTECFCFNRQSFAAGERKLMPMRFMLDPELPAEVDTVTLSYTFFDAPELAQR
ncbi:MAG TPA: cytochrome c oxidase assembly protein [Verrucomicrobiae bacterium]|nr:cytochrome c oxidase assembly protein [Verrucomicrobiae bacterium]